MTEARWLKADDGDAMLSAVWDRLTPRKWALLACGVANRVWDILPDGPFRDAIRFREDQANGLLPAADVSPWLQKLDDTLADAQDAAEARQRVVVAACDPNADRDEYQETAARRINPSVPLFRAASRSAWLAVEAAGIAVRSAAAAVRTLFTEPDAPRLSRVGQQVIDALVSQARAGGYAANALEYKATGDELADLGQVRNPRIRQAEAEETVRRLGDHAAQRHGNLEEQKARVVGKAVGKLLLEQLGNPFRPYRFEPQWRTEHVVGLARAIDEDRALERYPILLDALLDANCDEETVLRHVRGTEAHNPNAQHSVGCWVIDLILQKDEPLYALPPVQDRRPASPPQRTAPVRPTPARSTQRGLFDDTGE